jgi:Protein of unknown function (DUF2510)
MSTPISGPGWQSDPSGVHQQRYWDGARWTEHVADNGVQGQAALTAPAPATAVTPMAPVVGYAPMNPAMPKSKTTAVLLAVFLGFWTWLYTYKTDAWKFWLNLGLGIVTIGIFWLASWVWAIIDTSVRSDTWYQQFPNGDVLAQQGLSAPQPPHPSGLLAPGADMAAPPPPDTPPPPASPPPPLFPH